MLVFEERGREKPFETKERTDNKLNPHMESTLGFEPGPHWWEASALTTAPSLAPLSEITVSIFSIWGISCQPLKMASVPAG